MQVIQKGFQNLKKEKENYLKQKYKKTKFSIIKLINFSNHRKQILPYRKYYIFVISYFYNSVMKNYET